MSVKKPTIIYTETDEAPALATYSLLPIIERMRTPVELTLKPETSLYPGGLLPVFPIF